MSGPRAFCTLFDVNYAARAVALQRSLLATHADVVLWMFCMDEAASGIVAELGLDGVRIVPLDELERFDPALRAVRPTRSPIEYCWTATPAVCRYCLEGPPGLDEVSYLDADLFFRAGTDAVFAEMGTASVLLTPHRFAPAWEHREAEGGAFNVQFMTFRRTEAGLRALRWWHERCLEWCYDRHEEGRFGDQQYLDAFPRLFAGVHQLQHLGGGVAPWNAARYVFGERAGRVVVDRQDLIFYHHHGLELHLGTRALWLRALSVAAAGAGLAVTPYELVRGPVPLAWRCPPLLLPDGGVVASPGHAAIWALYVRALATAYAEIRRIRPGFTSGADALPVERLKRWAGRRRGRRGTANRRRRQIVGGR